MKTIVVDDEKWILEQFEDDCKDIDGIEIVGKFRSPTQALKYAKDNCVELAFLDIEMPEMNGLELSAKLRAILPKVIVIFVSAYDGYMLDAFRKQNADYFLIKPYSHSDLESAIERAILLSGRLRKRIFLRTFGKFEMLVNNEPLKFESEKAKELLALLVDNRGQPVATTKLAEILCAGETIESLVFRKILVELHKTLKAKRIADLVKTSEGGMRIQIENVDCDLMMFEDGNSKTIQSFDGLYMEGYGWGERTKEQLKKKLSLYERYQEVSTRDALCAVIRCLWDEDFTLEYVNDSFLAITGYSREELRSEFGNSLLKIIVPEDWSAAELVMRQQLGKGEFKEIEYRIKCKNGNTLWVLDKGRLSVYEKDGEVIREFECMIIDISAYKSKLSELELCAEQDTLTKLYTRGTAQRMIEEYLSKKPHDEKCAMALLDIDNFKQINDTYGHPFADTVLTDVAAIMKRSFRSDDIVCRLGGDEMVVFLLNIPDEEFLRGRIEAFYEELSKRMVMKTTAGEITCSLGVSMGPEDGETFASLYEEADIALYRSKQSGKGCATLRRDIRNELVQMPKDEHAARIHQEDSLVKYMRQQLAQSKCIPDTVSELLATIGKRLESSRVYIFEKSADNLYLVNTFEWCEVGCPPEIDNLQELPCEFFSVYAGMLKRNDGMFNVYDINTMEPQVYEILEPQGIQSMIHTELCDQNGECYGILGVDECRQKKYWSGLQCMTLKICGKEIGKALSLYRKRRWATKELQEFVASQKGRAND